MADEQCPTGSWPPAGATRKWGSIFTLPTTRATRGTKLPTGKVQDWREDTDTETRKCKEKASYYFCPSMVPDLREHGPRTGPSRSRTPG